MTETVIATRSLSKTFRTRGRTVEAVRDISFEVARGERLAYIGPNGAGKSTSIKILTGILHPTDGEALVLGHVPWRERKQLTMRIGTLFGQRSQLWFELTPRQSFRMLAAIYKMEPAHAARRVAELGELLDAEDLFDAPSRTHSLGQRMRCELAACLLHEPEIVFLDEPTIGLDLLAKQRFRELLVRLNETAGVTIFLTSHDIADIEHVARRAIVVNHGSVIHDADVAAMRHTLLSRKLIEVTFAEEVPAPDLEGVHVLAHRGATLELAVDTDVRSVRDVLDDVLGDRRVVDITVLDPPLEDVIAEIYQA
jgi:ABC-2 type transport system ATP-binding protein